VKSAAFKNNPTTISFFSEKRSIQEQPDDDQLLHRVFLSPSMIAQCARAGEKNLLKPNGTYIERLGYFTSSIGTDRRGLGTELRTALGGHRFGLAINLYSLQSEVECVFVLIQASSPESGAPGKAWPSHLTERCQT